MFILLKHALKACTQECTTQRVRGLLAEEQVFRLINALNSKRCNNIFHTKIQLYFYRQLLRLLYILLYSQCILSICLP